MSAAGLAGRGDLVRVLASGRSDLLAAAAAMLGYVPVPRPRRRRKPVPLPPSPPLPPASPDTDTTSEARPRTDLPYWVPIAFEALAEAAEPGRRSVAGAVEKVEWSGRPPPPEPVPLAPWNDLAARLRLALAEPVATDRLDVDAIVARLGRGELIDRLPTCRRRKWGRRLLLIDDRSRRLTPFWPDQDEVAHRIRALFPRDAVDRARSWGVASPPMVISGPRRGKRIAPETGTRVLLMGDLGCLDDVDRVSRHHYWEDLGRRLVAAGCRTIALIPAPPDRWIGSPGQPWRQVAWERTRRTRPVDAEGRARRARRLLRLMAPAIQFEVGLLRTARCMLAPDEADAATEADAWTDPAVASWAGLTATMEEADHRTLRQEFADDGLVSPELRRRVLAALRAWRSATPRGVWFEEVVSLDDPLRRLLPAGDTAEAAAYFAAIAERAAAGRGRAEVLAWFRRLERRLPDHAWLDREIRSALNCLWALADQAEAPRTPPPAGFRASDVPSDDRPRRVHLSQRGGLLHASLEPPGPAEPGSLFADIDSRNRLITLAELEWDDDPAFWRAGAAPAWAREWGTDAFGAWVTFAVPAAGGSEVIQRLRWIPPGTFLMGSPADEPERYDDEGPQHAVTISRGFWLAETACTQALWQAVTGDNPSGFKGDDRPVERVSWNDVRAFLDRINRLLPGLDLRLPTEAEWEYACRAGTTTPFSFGANIMPEWANYDGNFPYAGGSKGQYRQQTVPVASLPPNRWGLFEMHGNVWEWCADTWHASYEGAPLDGSAWENLSKPGVLRVLRGGSWNRNARAVRSASRSWYDPDDRGDRIGFRCARVPDGAEPGVAATVGAAAGWAGAGRQAERRTATDRLAGAAAGAALLRLDADSTGASVPLPAAPAVIVRSDCESLTLDRMTRPAWASGIGRDRFGLWAEVEIVPAAEPPRPSGQRARRRDAATKSVVELPQAAVVQRLRWIPPGRFLMGSPADEPGRWDDEGPQHLVTIGRGFWLAETPCTQALWQAVMGGDNPSRFQSPDRPVEQVSWKDVQTFLARINDRVPGLNLVLPSEAQWEYACRAGSATAIYTGGMPILGERNAPALDPIAWYGGNSGVGFELDHGYDSSVWPEKQYPHQKAGTRPVRLKRPNGWSLYDMLGNVWEWCADAWHASYEGAPADGSDWQDAGNPGAERVLRGGSWDSGARGVRSACRLGLGPGYRNRYIGFRCARVQP